MTEEEQSQKAQEKFYAQVEVLSGILFKEFKKRQWSWQQARTFVVQEMPMIIKEKEIALLNKKTVTAVIDETTKKEKK